MTDQLRTPGGLSYTVVFADHRSKLVEFHMEEGQKPFRVLYQSDAPVTDPYPDAHFLLNEEGSVTGVLTLDLAEFWGGAERYQEHHPEFKVVPAIAVPSILN